MTPFDYGPRTRIVFGPDTIDQLGELACEIGSRRALIVSDPGIVEAGHTDRGLAALKRAGIETQLFDGVFENPSTKEVEQGLQVANRFTPELIVGLGGGSSMDCAKGINFLYSNGGQMEDYWGVGKATRAMLPMIAIPTTAGTGSETQSFALISNAKTHVKMACGDSKASFRIAILDPKLTMTQPSRITALTGVDAFAHAIETYVTQRRNAASLAFSREAWLLISENFSRVMDNPDDLNARSAMQLGASFAGLAIENSMLGAAHALANPLTARYGIVHGQAVGLMLPHVVRFNGVQCNPWYEQLLEIASGSRGVPSPGQGAEGIAQFATELVLRAGLSTRLIELGVQQDQLPRLAADAQQQWTVKFNPREANESDLLKLYEAAFD